MVARESCHSADAVVGSDPGPEPVPATELSDSLRHPCYFPKEPPEAQVSTNEKSTWSVIGNNRATDPSRLGHGFINPPDQSFGNDSLPIHPTPEHKRASIQKFEECYLIHTSCKGSRVV